MSHPIVGQKRERITLDEVRSLVQRAHAGDPEAVPLLRRVLDVSPEAWSHFGDLAKHAELAWIRLIAGDDLLLGECLVRQVEALRRELAGRSPSPLEQLLIDRVVSCWLQVGYCEAAYAQFKGDSLKHADVVQKRMDAAQKRFLAAVKGLGALRKLLPVTDSTRAGAGVESVAKSGPAQAPAVKGDEFEEIQVAKPRSSFAARVNGDGAALSDVDDDPMSPLMHQNRIAAMLEALRAGPEHWQSLCGSAEPGSDA